MSPDFTHFDSDGNAVMVDVGGKPETARRARAAGSITMSRECFGRVMEGGIKKGDVLGTARIAGIMATKQTPYLIPLCHVLNITRAAIDFASDETECRIDAVCTVETTGRTGAEMEALTGVSAALLTIYDMCKAVDKCMVISGIALMEKSGGKSGVFRNPAFEGAFGPERGA